MTTYKKRVSYLYRTAATAYPCSLPRLGDSAGAGRIRLTRHKDKQIFHTFANESKRAYLSDAPSLPPYRKATAPYGSRCLACRASRRRCRRVRPVHGQYHRPGFGGLHPGEYLLRGAVRYALGRRTHHPAGTVPDSGTGDGRRPKDTVGPLRAACGNERPPDSLDAPERQPDASARHLQQHTHHAPVGLRTWPAAPRRLRRLRRHAAGRLRGRPLRFPAGGVHRHVHSRHVRSLLDGITRRLRRTHEQGVPPLLERYAAGTSAPHWTYGKGRRALRLCSASVRANA